MTSDRIGFILDSPEYLAFRETMRRVAHEVFSEENAIYLNADVRDAPP